MAVENDREFVKRLAAVRAAYGALTGRPGLNATDYAKELGLGDEAYRRYERGETRPQMDTFRRIRELTGISLDYLICGAIAGYPDPSEFSGPCGATFAQRLKWARELMATPEKAAEVMKVSLRTWNAWESGLDPMPTEAMSVFAERFAVSMPYLLHGLPVDVAPPVLAQLRAAHPELWRTADKARTGEDESNTHPTGSPPIVGLRLV